MAKLLPVTRKLVFSRPQLRNYYDTWIAQRSNAKDPAGFLYAIASTMYALRDQTPLADPAVDGDALALVLTALPTDGDRFAFFSATLSAGFFDGAVTPDGQKRFEMRRSLTRKFLKALPSKRNETVSQLQANETGEEAFGNKTIWADPGDFAPAMILAARRMCRVEIRENNGSIKRTGTGFLIGPSAIITNFHVVHDRPDTLPKRTAITCNFDYSETTGQKNARTSKHFAELDWCIAKSETGPNSPQTDVVNWWTNPDLLDAWLVSLVNKLDYAVIRLDGAPGLQRGWYDLASLTEAEQLVHGLVLHHPAGLDQTVTFGDMSISAPEDARLFHEAATSGGSSGGLLLNQIGQPVGLHYLGIDYQRPVPAMGDPDAKEHAFMNVAVSLHHIARDLKSKESVADVAAASRIVPYRGCLDGVHPVFGRHVLLNKLHEMWRDPDKRLMMVHLDQTPGEGIEHPGKSFTIDIIKSIFRSPEHQHIVFRAGETEADARQMAKAALGNFVDDIETSLPAVADTTTAAYVQRLVSYLGKKLREKPPNQSIWLMIDDLDIHTLADASGREFLATVYDQIKQLPSLRVVLIGLKDGLPISGIDPRNLVRDHIQVEDVSGFDKLFKEWLNERGARDLAEPLGPATMDILAQTVVSCAGETAPLRDMAEFVSSHIAEVAERLFGTAIQPVSEDDI